MKSVMAMRHRTAFLTLALACAVVFFALPVYAQFDFGGSNVSLTISPEHPAPGSPVRVTAASVLLDLPSSDITWFVNGTRVAGGGGLASTDVVAGALGTATEVSVAVVGSGGQTATATARIVPVEIDLLWESDSYVPPFYRGRALPSAGTNLRLEAVPRFQNPDGSFVAASDIIFTWRRDGRVVQSASGRGKSRVLIAGPALFGRDTISVDAVSADGTLSGSASVSVPETEPVLDLYKDHPLFGIMYHQALAGRATIPEIEMSFAAVPYFAQSKSANDADFTYAWQVNGRGVTSDSARPSEITINAQNSSGLALIELALSHATNFFMSSLGSWGITLSAGSAGGTPSPFNAGFPQ